MKTRFAVLTSALAASVLSSACATTQPDVTPVSRACMPRLEAMAASAPTDGVVPPRVVSRVAPQPAATLLGQSREATVDVFIDPAGVPQLACVAGGDLSWGSVVADAVRFWRFEPARQNGKPVSSRFTVTASAD